jgi:hypothetical protein
MKKQMLKIAGVKSEKEFYDKFPDEASFMAKHGKEFKKAMRGSKIEKAQVGTKKSPVDQSPGPGWEWDPYMNQWVFGGMDYSQMEQKGTPSVPTKNPYDEIVGGLSKLTGEGTGVNPQTKAPTTEGTSSDIIPYLQAGVDVIGGISMIKGQRDAVRQAKQMAQLTGVQSAAAASRPMQQPRRQYVRPEDVIPQPEQMFPSYGVGTNVLAQDGAMIGGTPTEIQNMYNPGTLYSDLGYEPLNDTSKVKQYVAGGKLKKAADGSGVEGGFDIGSLFSNQQIMGGVGQLIEGKAPEAGNRIGRGIGTAAGTAIGGPIGGAIGGLLGSAIGGIVDRSEEKIKRYQDQATRSMGNIMGQQMGVNIQNRFGAFMQDGGTTSPYEWVSHTWQPRTITQFGEYKMKDLLKPPADADMLRAGGHLKAYTPPSARAMSTERPAMQMGGELQTHWGGYAEPMSYNPYLPDGGETIMFRGQSHDESDGRGNTGIGITYGENPVEVERGEPAVKLQDGTSGDTNLTVFGNINITKAFASMLGDSKAQGKKFKTYVADLSKQENKQNKLIDKSIDQLDNMNVQNSFDKLALGTLQANIEGANAKLKDLAEKKMDAAALQNAINDSKEEDLLNVTDSGEVLAKKGANIPKAQRGTSSGKARAAARTATETVVPMSIPGTIGGLPFRSYLPTYIEDEQPVEQEVVVNQTPSVAPIATQRTTAATTPRDTYKSKYGLEPWRGNVTGLGAATASELSARQWDEIADKLGFKGRGNKEFQEFLLKNPQSKPLIEARHQRLYGKDPFVDEKLGAGWEGVIDLVRPKTGGLPRELKQIPGTSITPKLSAVPTGTTRPMDVKVQEEGFNFIPYLNQAISYLRRPDEEQLDPRQLLGEMYALSTNQVEPVYAQKFMPQLSTPVDISLQDILNQNQADYNATQRLVGYNPEGLAMLNAQKYQANQRVLGEQFRMNQAERQRVYEQNRNLLNQANLTNLQILDRQQERQATALSKTKETTRRALESISDKFLKNRLQNRTLATAQNLFNYRYDPSFRTVNVNPLWQPIIPDAGTQNLSLTTTANSSPGLNVMEQAALKNLLSLTSGKDGVSVKKSHLNSSIVKALKKL